MNVSVDSEVRVDVRLGVGEVSQTVEVSAEVGILKTERSDVATTYSDRVITNLLILNRRFTNFQLMTPGVVSFPTSLTAASAENPQGSYRMLVNGQSFAGTSHLLDGTDNHDAVLGWIVINPTLESVTEAKITTANYNAEFGVASAGVVSAQTRSGYPIYDPASGPPASRTRFPGDIIPANRLSAPAQNLLKLIPMPNTAAALDQPNFTASGGVKFNDDAFNVRADHFTTDKLHVFGRYSLQDFRMVVPGAFGLVAGGRGLDASGSTSAYAGASESRNHSVAAGFDYNMRSELLTDFRFGWFRYKVFGQPNGTGTTPALDAGIPGVNVDKEFNSGMPAFFINGYGNSLFKFGYALGVNGCNCQLIQNETIPVCQQLEQGCGNDNIKFGADMQFRAESFNFANHTNLANPNSCVDCPGIAGRIFGAFANYVPRQWQFALKFDY